jgi:hypothetical protein
MGLKGKAPSVDWKQMQAYKDDVIGQNTKGIEFLFKKNKIDWLKGWGQILDPRGGQGQGGRRGARGQGHRRGQRVGTVLPARDRDRREGRRDLRPARCRWARCRRRWS